MSAPADRYAAYTDGEITRIWNFDEYAHAERDALLAELERRGFCPINEQGHEYHLYARSPWRVPVPGGEKYTVALSRQADYAGDYRAAIHLGGADGELLMVVYDRDRAVLRERVAHYVDLHRSPREPDELYEL